MAVRKEQDNGFNDVSDAVEKAEEEAKAPNEVDDDGNVVPRESEATRAVYDEMSLRATAAANGGGPWPPELLMEVNKVGRLERELPAYTSHEQ